MKFQSVVSKLIFFLRQGIAEGLASAPLSSTPRALKAEGKKVKRKSRSSRSKSPDTQALSMSSSSHHSRRRDKSGRSISPTKPPLSASNSRRGRRSIEYRTDSHSNESEQSGRGGRGYQIEYESPTESLSSSLSSFPVESNSSTHDKYSSAHDKYSVGRREKDHLKDDVRTVKSNTMSTQKTTGTLSSHDGAMIEVAKITALVEEELQSQRKKHKDQLNRTIAKYKDRQEDSQREIDLLREERDNARRELENCKRNHGSQKRAAERNDRLQTQQKNRIEMLEEQKELFDQLQEERDALLDEVARSQQQQQKAKDELSVLKLRVRQDSQKRLSVMECLSTSWDAEKKEAQQKEALLNSELAIMSKTLKAEQQFLKNKNKEFAMLEAQFRVTKTELRSIKMTMVAKKEELELELRRERESRTRLAEEHKEMLKLKDDEMYMAESTIRTMKAELKSTRECFSLKEKLMEQSIAATNISEEESEVANPEAKMLREENSRLKDEIKELQKQLESYLANMALQQEFCDSLKSRIYDKQETEQEQIDEIHNLRKCIKNQEKDAAEKDLQIEELKQLLESNSAVKVEAKASRDLKRGKKSSMKKSKSSSRKSGYRSS